MFIKDVGFGNIGSVLKSHKVEPIEEITMEREPG